VGTGVAAVEEGESAPRGHAANALIRPLRGLSFVFGSMPQARSPDEGCAHSPDARSGPDQGRRQARQGKRNVLATDALFFFFFFFPPGARGSGPEDGLVPPSEHRSSLKMFPTQFYHTS
jgi:hypothetical protein